MRDSGGHVGRKLEAQSSTGKPGTRGTYTESLQRTALHLTEVFNLTSSRLWPPWQPVRRHGPGIGHFGFCRRCGWSLRAMLGFGSCLTAHVKFLTVGQGRLPFPRMLFFTTVPCAKLEPRKFSHLTRYIRRSSVLGNQCM